MPDHNFGDGRTLGEEIVWTFTEAGEDAPLAPLMPWYYDYWLASVLQYSTIDPSPVTDVLTSELESVHYDGLVANVLDLIIAAADDIDNNYDITIDDGGGGSGTFFGITMPLGRNTQLDSDHVLSLFPDGGIVLESIFVPEIFNYPAYILIDTPVDAGKQVYAALRLQSLFNMNYELGDPAAVHFEQTTQTDQQVFPFDGTQHAMQISDNGNSFPWLNSDGTFVTDASGIYKLIVVIQVGSPA